MLQSLKSLRGFVHELMRERSEVCYRMLVVGLIHFRCIVRQRERHPAVSKLLVALLEMLFCFNDLGLQVSYYLFQGFDCSIS